MAKHGTAVKHLHFIDTRPYAIWRNLQHRPYAKLACRCRGRLSG